MSNNPREGDKYVIEIEGVYGKKLTLSKESCPTGIHFSSGPTALYSIKGFPSVVFTEEDLRKLEKYEENDKQPGNPEVKVGDEVIAKDGRHVVVTRVCENSGFYSGLDKNGDLYNGSLRNVQRVGFKFPGIESAIAYMRKLDEGDTDEIERGE